MIFRKLNQLNSDMLSFRCMNFSFKQVVKKIHGPYKGGEGGGAPDHPDPPHGYATDVSPQGM